MNMSSAVVNPYDIELEQLNVADPAIFQAGQEEVYFRRLRDEAPLHYCQESAFGPYWSVTRYSDIMAVDTDHARFSSAGGITIGGAGGTPMPPKTESEQQGPESRPQFDGFGMFIAMDPPKHDVQRATVASVVAPRNLAVLEGLIRERAGSILDSLPLDESFDWVDRVSVELTTQMLATLFDFPFEDRRKLTRWSDVATTPPGMGLTETQEQRRAELIECLEYFTKLWEERQQSAPANDLISMLAHGESTKHMAPMEFLGNLLLLIVGGNDTTRNSISGGVLAMNEYPGELDKVKAAPQLIPNMVSEIIRWQTPLAHMRRTATESVEMHGQQIAAGDKVVMWYVSGNRDPRVIEQAHQFKIDRPRARQHLAFGYGIHRCMGNRLAEMQLRVLWEEMLKRFEFVEVVATPERSYSTFIRGFKRLEVRLHPR